VGPTCDELYQHVVEPIDAMKSLQVAGWFQGELRRSRKGLHGAFTRPTGDLRNGDDNAFGR
jgi:hypothetical protein